MTRNYTRLIFIIQNTSAPLDLKHQNKARQKLGKDWKPESGKQTLDKQQSADDLL